MPQLPHLSGQAADEAAVEAHVRAIEHQRGLGEPRHDAASHDLGTPGDRVVGTGERDPFVDQRAGIDAGDAGFGGAQMPQPAEAV